MRTTDWGRLALSAARREAEWGRWRPANVPAGTSLDRPRLIGARRVELSAPRNAD
jgi:hypothetical protein